MPIAEKFFTPQQVELHNSPDDCWVSFLGLVYNLTPLIEHNQQANPQLLRPILLNAGTDISHWFTPDGKQSLFCESTTAFLPYGPLLHVPPPLPRADWLSSVSKTVPWFADRSYCVGRLTARTRKLRIVNMLTHDEHTLTVCTEDTLAAIQDRFALVNAHAKGYIWKRLGIILDMAQGLVPDLIQDANGIPDETSEFERVGMDADLYLPAIHLYFSDDLTVC